ncbi:hypothetical protein F8R15_19770 [Thioclava sp. JE_KL1]|nr:hypothetical protein [Thioclava sp. JE_KL1]
MSVLKLGRTLIDGGGKIPWQVKDHLVRIIDLLVDELDLRALGFGRCVPARTGRPGYHPSCPP